jgi:DNA-binding transcriptional regulator LsrR (DeoR family)/ABC-type branched-subunit amino acid transport system ATPase component
MVGRDFVFEHRAPQPAEDQIVLEVRDLARKGVFEGINFSVARGEILGMAGLVGAGRTEVVRTIAGVDRFDQGEVILEGKPLKLRSPADAIRAGIVMVPEDRKGLGLLLTRSSAENIAHPWEGMLWRTGLITRAKVNKLAENSRREFDIRGSMDGPAGGLSGGNQQKVLLAKWLVKTPKVLILDEPTRGVDVGAKMAIYEIVRGLAAKGLRVIVVSSELEEVLGLSHRVLVMSAGRQRAVLRREAAKAETVMHFAVPVQHRMSHADAVESEMIDNNDLDQQRLATKAAWLYHNRQLQQRDIAARLGISQPRVSRLLDLAVSMGIVRTTVVPPEGLHAELEEQLEQRYGLREAHVFDVGTATDDEHELTGALGQLMAARLQAQRLEAEVIGFTSWSRSLRATVAALQPLHWSVAYVVETLGDIGPVMFQHEAADASRQLAVLTGAEALFLRIPGVVPNKALRDALLAHDPDARRALDLLDMMDMALVGIGTCEIVPPLVAGKNFFTAEQYQYARELGAVGEVCLHFIAEDGSPVATDLDELLVGVTLEQLRRTDRVLAVAGGPRKYRAIRASLLGGWVNALVTDVATAKYLIAH